MKFVLTLFMVAFIYLNANPIKPDIIWQKDINEMNVFNQFIDPAHNILNLDNDTLFLSSYSEKEHVLEIIKLDFDGEMISKINFDMFDDLHKDSLGFVNSVSLEKINISDSLYTVFFKRNVMSVGSEFGSLKLKKNGDFVGRFPLDTNQKMNTAYVYLNFIFNDTLYRPSLTATFDSVGNKFQKIYYDVFDENLKRLEPLFMDTNQINHKVSQPFWLSDFTDYRFIMPVFGPENKDRQYSVFCKTDRNLNVLEQKKVSIPGYYGFYHEQILSIRDGRIYCTGTVTDKGTLLGEKVYFILDTNFNLLSYKVWDNEFIKRLSLIREPALIPVNNHNNYLLYSFVSEGFETDDGMVPFALVLMDSECNVLETYEWSINDEAHDKFKALYEVSENEYIGLSWAGILMKFSLPVTSVKSNIFDDDVIKLYPTPASDELQITIEDEYFRGDLECSIISIDGQTIKHFNMRSNNKLISVSNLPNGIYFLKINGLYYNSIALKFIIKR